MSGAAGASGLPQVGGHPPLAAVLFDAGLTLIRSATRPEAVAEGVLAASGLPARPTELAAAMDAAQAHLEAVWHRGDWWAAEASVRELFESAYRRGLPEIAAVGADAALAARLASAIYADYQDTRHWALFEDVLPTLEALRKAGITMGIVSDWGHGLESIVLELELADYFAFLVVSSRLGIAKPQPGVFDMALARIGVPARQAVYIGDTYVKDVLGARSAGLAPVLLDRAGRGPAADCPTVRSLTELLPLLGLTAALPDTARRR